MTYEVRCTPLAREALFDLYAFIAQAAGLSRAGQSVERIERACPTLATFPERGRRRDDLPVGLRTIFLERRVLIALRVDGPTIIILRLLYAGRAFGTEDVPA